VSSAKSDDLMGKCRLYYPHGTLLSSWDAGMKKISIRQRDETKTRTFCAISKTQYVEVWIREWND